MITLSHISLALGQRTLFDNISFSIKTSQKIGLVGRNGAGKSTLFKVITKRTKPDHGTISTSQGLRIAYLPQEVVLESSRTVYDETMRGFEPYVSMRDRLHLLEQELAQYPHRAPESLDEMQELYDQLQHFDTIKADQNARFVLAGLGFSEQHIMQPVTALSVGWKMRLILAKLLLHDADFYLFDEPTNHLDITTKEWFLAFLKSMRTGFMLITHDRYFLDKAVDQIIEIERGHTQFFDGNFTQYVSKKEEMYHAQLAAKQQQDREIKQKQETIERFRASASKAKMAQSMIKQLERIERIEIEPPLPAVHFNFPPVIKSSTLVLQINNIGYSFGPRTIFRNASTEIHRGERVALIAPNGTGKSTLFNIIAGILPRQQGSIEFGSNVKLAVFEQDQAKALNQQHTILEEIETVPTTYTSTQIRALLGTFLFSADDCQKKIQVLSGGEKNRVAMVKVLVAQPNFLLLDEPTNHLDIYAQDVLIKALSTYQGTMLFVSHDQEFISRLATRILELTPAALHSYPGSYETFIHLKQQQRTPTQQSSPITSQKTSSAISETEKLDIKKRLRTCEQAIMQREQEQQKWYAKLETLTPGSSEYTKACTRLEILMNELNTLTHEWETLSEEL